MRTPTRPRSPRTCIAALLLALAVTAPAAAEAGAVDAGDGADATQAPFLGGFLEETRIVYPLRVGEWEAQGEHRYDQPELGASVRYQHREHGDRWIDLYFYPAGLLPPERLDIDAQRTLDELRSLVGQPGSYEDGDFDALRTFVIPRDGEDPIPARSAGMRLVRGDEVRHSALVLLVHDLYYVKGRFSVDEGALTRDETRAQLEGFIADVVRAVRIASSGGCGQRASSREPDTASTKRAVPGCTGPEPHEPEVPEGSRELRLEYRAPGRGGDGSDARPHRTRSALG